MRKILITGASGFVGGYLVEEAMHLGFETFAGIRASSNTQYLESLGAQYFIHDFSDAEQLSIDLAKYNFDIIVHNAGLTAASSLDQLMKVNCGTLQTLVNALRSTGKTLPHIVYISSLAAYGPADFQSDGIVSNDSTPNPVTNYGRSKLAAERWLKEQSDVPYTIIRPTAVYGPRDMEFLPVYKSVQSGIGLQVGFGDQMLTFIYVKDLAKVIINASMQQPYQKAYFVTDGAVHEARQYTKLISNALNKKAIHIKLPVPVVSGIAALSEWIGQRRGKYPVLNRDKVAELKSRSWVCDIQTLKKDLNFAPSYDLESGLRETLAWCKHCKLI